MIIKKVHAQEIFNSKAEPTIECTITLSNNQKVSSIIPSGFEQTEHSAYYLYDQDERFFHKGMKQSCDYINNTIAPMLENQPLNFLAMDSQLMDLDTSAKKSNVGANTTLAVSMSLCKAQALSENIELYELLQSLSGTKQVATPLPIISVLQPISHKNIQELLLIPQEKSYSKNITAAVSFQKHIHAFLKIQKENSIQESSKILLSSLTIKENLKLFEKAFNALPYSYQVGLNVEASNLYDNQTKTYEWQNQALFATELIQEYQKLIADHSYITYMQSAMADNDISGWQELTNQLDSISIAADTIFSSNAMRIRKGILQNISNLIIIRPAFIGTVSQTLAVIDACKRNKKLFCIASDQDYSSETFAADLATGTNAAYLKGGSVYTGEHIHTYNRLLQIATILDTSL